jgi:hypothetical protein
MVYPDWKYQIEALLGQKLPWEMNELLWELHDLHISTCEAACRILERSQLPIPRMLSGYILGR